MFKYLSKITLFKINYVIALTLFFVSYSKAQFKADQQRDGKFLRGEKWEKYKVPDKADFYVSVDGNDNWSGTLSEPNAEMTDGPFATISRAQKAVRELKEKVYKPKEEPVETRWIGSPHPYGKGKDILVLIRGGFYELEQPLVFGPEDGGERIETNLPTGAFEYHKLKDHYVTYAAMPGEKVVISGGRKIDGWKKKGKLWQASTGFDVKMLVADGKEQVLARTPNEGYFIPPVISETPDVLHFNPGELKNWKDMENNRVKMLLRWHYGYNSITKVDEKKRIAKLAKPQDGIVIVSPRYFVENVPALLDAPGEWYFDPKKEKLSFMLPEEKKSPDDIIIEAPQLTSLVEVRGERGRPVRNLRFYGINFEGALPGGKAISFTYAHSNEFVGNRITAVGGTAVDIGTGCYQTKILDNHIEGAGNMAIHIKGPEHPRSGDDILRETLVSHNYIAGCGGVNIDASFSLFTTISHNYITRTRGRYAISVGGWNNLEEVIDGAYLVEYNHLDDVQKDADDSGAIKTAGVTFNSVVRRNLIHDVHAGFFNDNVAFWFDNMSLGWVSKENIYYNLEQGEMKLCAANLVDNLYVDNYVVPAPKNKPEIFIEGQPELTFNDDLEIVAPGKDENGAVQSGTDITVKTKVFNKGATGIASVLLYLDGKVFETRKVPTIHNNNSDVVFNIRLYDKGKHELAIGGTEYKPVVIKGEKPSVVFEEMQLSDNRMLKDETVQAGAVAGNLTDVKQQVKAVLFVDDEEYDSRSMELEPGQKKEVWFTVSPPAGEHTVRIGNSGQQHLLVEDYNIVDVTKQKLYEYCSAKAKPYEINVDQAENRYRIKAGGSDFYHAEDSYASVYLKGIKGDFVATVKVTAFGERTHEWFRAGLFARNSMDNSFDAHPGSKGSFLVFTSPSRAGVNYDEFGNGCMHKASSQNLPPDTKMPVWLKLERHGNHFTGSVSLDGKNWSITRRSGDLPGLKETIDVGLAAGAPDKKTYWVEFEDWTLKVAKKE